MKPKRIQRKRIKGWRMPPNTICVSRPSRWGNPVKVYSWTHTHLVQRGLTVLAVRKTRKDAMEQAVNCYRDILDNMSESEMEDYLEGLRGKNLCCWCKIGEPCHADVLLEIANKT